MKIRELKIEPKTSKLFRVKTPPEKDISNLA